MKDAEVIGAGPAGLAVARELEHQHGIKARVIDRALAPAISWRTRYDNFRLNTTGFLFASARAADPVDRRTVADA